MDEDVTRQVVGAAGWGVLECEEPGEAHLSAVLDDDVAALRIPGVLAAESGTRLAVAVERHGFGWASDRTLERLCVDGPHPPALISTQLARMWPAGVVRASDPAGRLYMGGAFHSLRDCELACPGAGTDARLHASLCIRATPGSAVYLYRRRWSPDDPGDGNPWKVVTGVEFARVPLVSGDLLITDARLYTRTVVVAFPTAPPITFTCSVSLDTERDPMEVWS